MVRKIKSLYKTVETDDFELEDEHPHAGETVTFKRRITVRQLLKITNARNIQSQEEDEGSVTRLVVFLHDDICPLLEKVISEWTWKDIWGEEEYGTRPTLEILRDMGVAELTYLMSKWVEVATGETDVEKNQPKPSSEQ